MIATTGVAAIETGLTRSIGAIAFAGTIGTIIEWYDFFLYGTAAALVFNAEFFPALDPRVGTLAALRRSRWASWPGRSAARLRSLRRPLGRKAVLS